MYFHNNSALQTCRIYQNACLSTRHHVKWNASARTKTMQLSSGLQVELMCCSAAEAATTNAIRCNSSIHLHVHTIVTFWDFPHTFFIYSLPSVYHWGEYFAIVLEVCWFRNCYYELKTAVLDKHFAHAPQWISIGIARCIVSQQASRLTKCRLNFLVFTFVFQMNAVFHFCVQYTVVFVYIITFIDKESEHNVGWRSWDVSQHANISFNL